MADRCNFTLSKYLAPVDVEVWGVDGDVAKKFDAEGNVLDTVTIAHVDGSTYSYLVGKNIIIEIYETQLGGDCGARAYSKADGSLVHSFGTRAGNNGPDEASGIHDCIAKISAADLGEVSFFAWVNNFPSEAYVGAHVVNDVAWGSSRHKTLPSYNAPNRTQWVAAQCWPMQRANDNSAIAKRCWKSDEYFGSGGALTYFDQETGAVIDQFTIYDKRIYGGYATALAMDNNNNHVALVTDFDTSLITLYDTGSWAPFKTIRVDNIIWPGIGGSTAVRKMWIVADALFILVGNSSGSEILVLNGYLSTGSASIIPIGGSVGGPAGFAPENCFVICQDLPV